MERWGEPAGLVRLSSGFERLMQRLDSEGLFLLAPELAGRTEGFWERAIGQIHRQVMTHPQVRDYGFKDRLSFFLEALPISNSGFTGSTYIPIPLGGTGVFEPESAVV